MGKFRYLSVCSGIEAATVAWHHLGWEPAAFSDIEAFPRALLRHHYPQVPLHGRDQRRGEDFDTYAAEAGFQTIKGNEYGSIRLICGGTPCQSFSIAGRREGMDDDRGNLSIEFLRLAKRSSAQWVLWENVPGVLSSNGGRDFGAILAGLAEFGYGFAYRILDAQHFGIPQRRRRVFLVGYLGDWRPPAAVLFERHCLQGHSAPSRGARQNVAALTANGVGTCGADDNQAQAGHLITFSAKDYGADAMEEISPTLRAGGHDTSHQNGGVMPAVAYDLRGREHGAQFEGPHDTANIRAASGGSSRYCVVESAVRRLTPRECERLMGFPDNYTKIPYRGRPADKCPDGPRYKALGNSWAVPCARWIGERIKIVDDAIESGEWEL